jgi:polyphosphate kinase
VGRFLEHSRIFYFENGARANGTDDTSTDGYGGEPEYYIGSADWMTRNLDHRVEAITPVEDHRIRRQLKFNLELILADNRKRWTMNSDGSYDQRYPGDGEDVVDTQAVLMEQTERAQKNDDVTAGLAMDFPLESDILVTAETDEKAAVVSDPQDTQSAPQQTGDGGTLSEDPLDRYPECWYRPDSDIYEFTVRTPEGGRRYLKTREGAATAIRELYDS